MRNMIKRLIIIFLLIIFVYLAEDIAKAEDNKGKVNDSVNPATTIAKPDNPVSANTTASADKNVNTYDKDAEIKKLKNELKSEKVFERWKAAYESGRNANPVMIDDLAVVLNDKDLKVRIEAVQSLGKIGDKKAVDYLMPLLKDKVSGVRYTSLKSLVKIGNPSVKPLILEIETWQYRDRGIIIAALKAITKMNYDKPEQWIEWLKTHDTDVSDTVKTNTAKVDTAKIDTAKTNTPKVNPTPTVKKSPENELITEEIDENIPIEKRNRPVTSSSKMAVSSKNHQNNKSTITKSVNRRLSSERHDSPVIDKSIPEHPVPIKSAPQKAISEKPKVAKEAKVDKSDNKTKIDKTFEELEEEAK